MIIELNGENFNSETKQGLKLVEFYTTWCKFCVEQDKILKELDENIWVGKLDCDKYQQIAKDCGVTGFPSFALFKNGEKVLQFAGLHTKGQILNKLMRYI